MVYCENQILRFLFSKLFEEEMPVLFIIFQWVLRRRLFLFLRLGTLLAGRSGLFKQNKNNYCSIDKTEI